jgi:hypothetical protein
MALWLMLLGFRGGEDMQRLAGGWANPATKTCFSEDLGNSYCLDLCTKSIRRSWADTGKMLGRWMRMACKGLSCRMAPPARNLFIVIGFFTILNVAWKDSGAES